MGKVGRENAIKFYAAHFIPLHEGKCRRLHGHNYYGDIIISDALKVNGMIIDFNEIIKSANIINDVLDHRILIPKENHKVIINRSEGMPLKILWTDRYGIIRNYEGPDEDFALLDIKNTTAEELARWMSKQLTSMLKMKLTVRLYESKDSYAEWGD
jgi:6-pyruvoyltetrahydropterin/6-carboxytetrahydropterin synthase